MRIHAQQQVLHGSGSIVDSHVECIGPRSRGSSPVLGGVPGIEVPLRERDVECLHAVRVLELATHDSVANGDRRPAIECGEQPATVVRAPRFVDDVTEVRDDLFDGRRLRHPTTIPVPCGMREPSGAPRFDPSDLAFLHDPYPTYEVLRNDAPFTFHAPWNAWIVTRHADVDALLRDRRLGRVVDAVPKRPADPAHEPFDRIQAGSLLEIEPPDHTRVRQVVHEAFTPKHVRAMAQRVDDVCRRQADRLAAALHRGSEPVDLLRVFAEPIPVTVIADLLGVPEQDRHNLLPWSKRIIGMFEPQRTLEAEAAAVQAAHEFAEYVRGRVDAARRHPGDDLISRMTAVHDEDDGRLSMGELVANAILFLNAGHEAVVNVIGNGMLALLQRPQVWAEVQEDRSAIPGAVEEMMRFDTPLQFFERYAHERFEFVGDDGEERAFEAGTKFALYYASANHDDRVFRDPSTFDVRRSPNPHLALGLGVHYCIGAPLARMEVARALEALLDTVPTLRLAARAVQYEPRNVFRYLSALPVTLDDR